MGAINIKILQKLEKNTGLLEFERKSWIKMMSLSNKIIFDISSRLSCVVLNTAPYASKASFSTGNYLEAQGPSIPKRPLSGYIRYSNEIRPGLAKKNPNLKMSEISKLIALQYKELPVGRKEALNEAYQIDKKKYEAEKEKFQNTSEGKELLEKKKQAGKEKKLSKFKIQLKNLKEEMGKPKRYPLPINLFAKEQLAGMSGKITDNMKIVTQKWGTLSETQKAPYVKKSEELKAKYEKDLAVWEATQGTEGLGQIEDLQKKISSARNAVKGIEPKVVKKPKKVVAKKVKKAATKETPEKKVAKKEPAKDKKKA